MPDPKAPPKFTTTRTPAQEHKWKQLNVIREKMGFPPEVPTTEPTEMAAQAHESSLGNLNPTPESRNDVGAKPIKSYESPEPDDVTAPRELEGSVYTGLGYSPIDPASISRAVAALPAPEQQAAIDTIKQFEALRERLRSLPVGDQ